MPYGGTRPILVEVQALISHTNFGMPRRTSVGTDYNKVNLLMAVIEKKWEYKWEIMMPMLILQEE